MKQLKYHALMAAAGALFSGNACADIPRYVALNEVIQREFYRAAVTNEAKLIRDYLNRGYSIDTMNEDGFSALCEAVKNGQDEAYSLLLSFGANPYAKCIKKAENYARQNKIMRMKKYGKYALMIGAGAGIAFGLGGGGGNGGGGVDSGEDQGGSDNSGSSMLDYYNNLKEFNSSYMSFKDGEGNVVPAVNYLGEINAASAYASFSEKDSSGEVRLKLNATNSVGVIDSGVWGNHNEFSASSSNKVSGYNYDYGPCTASDTTNCWMPIGDIEIEDGIARQRLVFYDNTGTPDNNQTSLVTCDVANGQSSCDPFEIWKNTYAANYDWDAVKNSSTAYYPNDCQDGELCDSLHGTNVASIIGADKNGYGTMGVAWSNTSIKAVRWDLKSSLNEAMNKLLNDGVVAVNMSFGTEASDENNASHTAGYDFSGLAEFHGIPDIMAKYETKTSQYTGRQVTDGMIMVKSAGNDSYEEPDFLSGIKLHQDFKDLMMLVVVSVDVKMKNNQVESYSLSKFSNQCGVTGSYCISAPGGNYDPATGKTDELVIGAGAAPDEYDGMAGTSQAAPLVTGSIAFLKNAFPYMASSEVIDLILNTAYKSGAENYQESVYGAGLLDLGAAVNMFLPIINANGQTSVVTISGNNMNGEKIDLNTAHLNVPAVFKNAVRRALPQTITVFDRYGRPFAFKTANYVAQTHAGHKILKNDVYNLSRKTKIQKLENGNVSLAFAGTSQRVDTKGLGFIEAEYKHGKNASGFYFSENTGYDADNYFASDLRNPFMTFTTAYGMYNTFDFSNGIKFKLEAVSGRNGLYDGDTSYNDNSFKKQAYAMNAELQLFKGRNFGFNLSSGLLYEDEAMLGMNGDGALGISCSNTYNTGVTMQWFATPKLTLSGSYFRGFTKAQSFESSLLKTSDLVSESFAFDANYQWDKTLNLGLQISSPLRVKNGTLVIDFASGRDDHSDTVYRNTYKAGLKPEAREYKFALYANKDVSERVSFSGEFDVRVNPEHQKTDNDYRALFGLNWNFN